MTAFVDTNVIIRHLTGDPPEKAAKATRYLGQVDALARPCRVAEPEALIEEAGPLRIPEPVTMDAIHRAPDSHRGLRRLEQHR